MKVSPIERWCCGFIPVYFVGDIDVSRDGLNESLLPRLVESGCVTSKDYVRHMLRICEKRVLVNARRSVHTSGDESFAFRASFGSVCISDIAIDIGCATQP